MAEIVSASFSTRFQTFVKNVSVDVVIQTLRSAGCKIPERDFLQKILHGKEREIYAHKSGGINEEDETVCITCTAPAKSFSQNGLNYESSGKGDGSKSYFESEEQKIRALCNVLKVKYRKGEDGKGKEGEEIMTGISFCDTCEIQLKAMIVLKKFARSVERQNAKYLARFKDMCKRSKRELRGKKEYYCRNKIASSIWKQLDANRKQDKLQKTKGNRTTVRKGKIQRRSVLDAIKTVKKGQSSRDTVGESKGGDSTQNPCGLDGLIEIIKEESISLKIGEEKSNGEREVVTEAQDQATGLMIGQVGDPVAQVDTENGDSQIYVTLGANYKCPNPTVVRVETKGANQDLSLNIAQDAEEKEMMTNVETKDEDQSFKDLESEEKIGTHMETKDYQDQTRITSQLETEAKDLGPQDIHKVSEGKTEKSKDSDMETNERNQAPHSNAMGENLAPRTARSQIKPIIRYPVPISPPWEPPVASSGSPPTRKSDRLRSAPPFYYSGRIPMPMTPTKKPDTVIKVGNVKVKLDSTKLGRNGGQDMASISAEMYKAAELVVEHQLQNTGTSNNFKKSNMPIDDDEYYDNLLSEIKANPKCDKSNFEVANEEYQCSLCKELLWRHKPVCLELVPQQTREMHISEISNELCNSLTKPETQKEKTEEKAVPLANIFTGETTTKLLKANGEGDKKTLTSRKRGKGRRRKGLGYKRPCKKSKLENDSKTKKIEQLIEEEETAIKIEKKTDIFGNLVVENNSRRSKIAKVPCPHCSKYVPGWLMSGHVQFYHNNMNRKYICTFCTQRYLTQSQLTRHISQRHKRALMNYKCTHLECNKGFAEEDLLKVHEQEEHVDEAQVSNPQSEEMKRGEGEDGETMESEELLQKAVLGGPVKTANGSQLAIKKKAFKTKAKARRCEGREAKAVKGKGNAKKGKI